MSSSDVDMDSQQYSLSWNQYFFNLSVGFQSLLRDQDLVDVTIAVNGRYFKAHKIVLSICSPYFKELFLVNPCQHPVVFMQDVDDKILECMLTFMYQGEARVSQSDLDAFLKLAGMLKIKGLHDDVQEELVQVFDDFNFKNEINTNGVCRDIKVPARKGRSKIKSMHFETPTSATILDTPSTSTLPLPPAKRIKTNCDSFYQEAEQTQTEFTDETINNKTNDTLPIEGIQHEELESNQNESISDESQHRIIKPDVNNGQVMIYNENMQPQLIDMNNIMKKVGNEYYRPSIEEIKRVFANGGERENMTDPEVIGNMLPQGKLMLLKSRRGLPVLIHDGHIYTKQKVEARRMLWVCVKQRNLQCGGCITTDLMQQNVLSFCGHNHRQLHDIIKGLQTGGNILGSGSSNCDSSSNSSPSRQDPTDLSIGSLHS